jgi:hypothetical protein
VSVTEGSILLTPVAPNPVDPTEFDAKLSRIVKERRTVLRRLAQ